MSSRFSRDFGACLMNNSDFDDCSLRERKELVREIAAEVLSKALSSQLLTLKKVIFARYEVIAKNKNCGIKRHFVNPLLTLCEAHCDHSIMQATPFYVAFVLLAEFHCRLLSPTAMLNECTFQNIKKEISKKDSEYGI
ncbi:CLUMA_CG018324, isoform A [Clunio marinus]|uniref:CLUMA_CG018324, isoform A n=1 Tax=Clunio marinus TaxID=568069 RepID=A0A1J1IXN0_9DIPT|nr:CLUMA_CG018324, isoform A [Clunio marinus]